MRWRPTALADSGLLIYGIFWAELWLRIMVIAMYFAVCCRAVIGIMYEGNKAGM